MSSLVQIQNSLAGTLESSIDPYSDILQQMIVERWDNRYQRRAVVHMDWNDMQHFDEWLKIELSVGPKPKLKAFMEEIREVFPGIQTNDILEGLYRYY